MLGPQHARLLAFFCFLAVCHVIEADLGGFPAVVAFTAAVAAAAVVATRSDRLKKLVKLIFNSVPLIL